MEKGDGFYKRRSGTSSALRGVTKDLRNHALQTEVVRKAPSTGLSCFIAFSQEVTSHTWKILACGHQL